MTPTALNLFFVQGMLSPEDTRGWVKFQERGYARTRREDPATREKERAASKEYHTKNREKANAATRKWQQENPIERHAATNSWNKRNPDKVREKTKRKRNKPGHKEQVAQYIKNRKSAVPEFKLLLSLRGRVNKVLGGHAKSGRSLELLGMALSEYKIYLQGQFLPGMTWENHGTVWHIDHIRPCASFDLTDPAQQRICFNWSNTQPLFAAENLRKGDSYVSN